MENITDMGFSKELSLISEKINSCFSEDLKKFDGMKFKNEEYVIDLTKNLNDEIYKDLITFFKGDFFVKRAKKFLGLDPILSNLMIYANLESEINSKSDGSKEFHRDSNTYKVFEVFFAVTEITEKNGPFYFFNPSKNLSFENFIKDGRKLGWKEYNRFSEKHLEKKIGKKEVLSLIGKPGTWSSLNSGVTYHKGGFVEEFRIVGRAIYSGIEYQDSKENSNRTSKVQKLLIKFHNFLAFKICKFYI